MIGDEPDDDQPAPAAPEAKAAEPHQPHVTPGMVPRESDYDSATEPAMTVTDPEPEPVVPPAAPQPSHRPHIATQGDILPVRPDVEPLDELPAAAKGR